MNERKFTTVISVNTIYLSSFEFNFKFSQKSLSRIVQNLSALVHLNNAWQKKSSLGFRARAAEALRRFTANQTEEERSSANERSRQRMAQMRAERRAARLEEARLRACQSSATSGLLPFEQNKRDSLRVTERRQQETEDQHQQDYVRSNHVIIIALHSGITQLIIIA